MRNVVRLFNDEVGVELCERTGRSPAFQYLQIGCSRAAEQQMLAFAKAQVGKPFSMVAMIRSVAWPRRTTLRNYFCAELVAAVLQAGGLMYATHTFPCTCTITSASSRFTDSHATATGLPIVTRVRQRQNRCTICIRGKQQ